MQKNSATTIPGWLPECEISTVRIHHYLMVLRYKINLSLGRLMLRKEQKTLRLKGESDDPPGPSPEASTSGTQPSARSPPKSKRVDPPSMKRKWVKTCEKSGDNEDVALSDFDS